MDELQADIFCDIGTALTSSLDTGEVYKRVMEIIGRYFSPRNWSLYLVDHETGRINFEIVMGLNAEKVKTFHMEMGEGIVGRVCLHGNPIFVEDTRKDPRFSPRIDRALGFTTRSLVCVPLLDGKNRVTGAIELINRVIPPSCRRKAGGDRPSTLPLEETFTEGDMKLLAAVGKFTGIATENATLHRLLMDKAVKDPLTGIYNRLYFDEALQRDLKETERHGRPVCILMADVDRFKAINDTHGHVVGDRVLCAVAGILDSAVRDYDTLARFGGDEFVILMPGTDENGGREVVGRIRSALEQWNREQSIPGVSVELSIGIHASKEGLPDTLLTKADEALYRCKRKRKEIPTDPLAM